MIGLSYCLQLSDHILNMTMSPLSIETFCVSLRNLISCWLQHILKAALIKDSTFNYSGPQYLDQYLRSDLAQNIGWL